MSGSAKNSGHEKMADLVLEGGGVRGIALVGAVQVLEEHGYRFNRVAGTSAGSIVGSLVAAGVRADDIVAWMNDLNYQDFCDTDWYENLLGGKAASLLATSGIFKGDFAHEWITDKLASAGVHTFADLRYADGVKPLPRDEQYRLVVNVSDLSQGCLRRFPYDYRKHYGIVPDEASVADAVRASMSIPYFFRPVHLRSASGMQSWLVDGGLLSNFPVDVFDSPTGTPPRWPTFGIKLSAHPDAAQGHVNDIHGSVDMLWALASTLTGFYDRMHVDEPGVVARTIFIDTGKIKSTQFDLSEEDRNFLYHQGRDAAEAFLKNWSLTRYVKKFRTPQPSQA